MKGGLRDVPEWGWGSSALRVGGAHMARRLLRRPPKPLPQVLNPAQGQTPRGDHQDCEPRFENKTHRALTRPQEERTLTETRNAVSLGQNPHAQGVLGLPPAAAQIQRRASFPTRPRWSGLHLPNPQAPEVTHRRGSLRDNSVQACGRLTQGTRRSPSLEAPQCQRKGFLWYLLTCLGPELCRLEGSTEGFLVSCPTLAAGAVHLQGLGAQAHFLMATRTGTHATVALRPHKAALYSCSPRS